MRLMPMVQRLRERFGIAQVCIVAAGGRLAPRGVIASDEHRVPSLGPALPRSERALITDDALRASLLRGRARQRSKATLEQAMHGWRHIERKRVPASALGHFTPGFGEDTGELVLVGLGHEIVEAIGEKYQTGRIFERLHLGVGPQTLLANQRADALDFFGRIPAAAMMAASRRAWNAAKSLRHFR